jgi:putative membrane-bound dehydrogenase-like protein
MKPWLPLPLFAALFCATPAAHAQLTPERALTTFKVSEGLEISLWASEPMFVNPTCMDIDHKGRIWVCESVNYRNKLRNLKKLNRPEGDRILILEDTKGTGKADKVTVFYQTPDTLAPLGIAVRPHPNGKGQTVYVCQSPDILVFEDADGDGKADGPPRKLLTGFNGYDHDHGVHGILIGPDHKLYFSVGDTGVRNLVDKHGKKWSSNGTDCRAGTNWRCDLDGKNLELLAHNFRNQYEPCVDSFGTMFVSDNDDDGNQQTRICYVMPGGNYGYHPRGKGQTHWHEEQPGVVPKILRTFFGSPTGICVYEGTLLPEKYRGNLLHTDAGPRHLRCYHLTPDGASYAVKREDMVESIDNWFRPSDVCVAPDGAVYVADWYDPGVGGHGMGDTTRGRIYRVAPKGYQTKMPVIDVSTTEGLIAALGSPNLAARAMAMDKLTELGLPKALEALEPAAKQKENVWLRARALWQMARLGHLRWVNAAFGDPDPRFRILTMRIYNDFLGKTPGDYIPDWQDQLVKDPSPAVRREGLLLLRNAEPAKAKRLIYALAKGYDGKDRFYLAAVGIAVGTDAARRDAILADFAKELPEWNEQVANLVWELRPAKVLPLLERRLLDKAATAHQRAQIVDIVAGSADVDAGKVLLKVLISDPTPEVRERVVEHLKLNLQDKWAKLRASKELRDALAVLDKKTETIGLALALIGAAQTDDGLMWAVSVARNAKLPHPLRAAAVETLGQFKTAAATQQLTGLATGKDRVNELAVEAVMALGRQGTPGSQTLLQAMATDTAKYQLAERQAAVGGLAGTRPGTQFLLEASAQDKLSKDLTPDLARLLRNSPFPDLRNKALTMFPPPTGKLDLKNLPGIPALLARKGNVENGRKLMLASLKNDVQCLKCHTVRGTGGQVGPDLSVIGSKASRENLLESILYPSRAIADQYATWSITTTDGQVINGLIIEETPKFTLLRDANAKDYKLTKGDIDRKSKLLTSIMPDNLINYLSESDLIDMVDYLHSLKSPMLTPTSWQHIGPFDNGINDAGMKKKYPPEQGIDLAATYAGKFGPVKWRRVEPNAQGFVDLKALLAPKSDGVISYLYCEVESPAAQEARVLLGTDDCAVLWVNEKQVYKSMQHRAAVPEQDEVRVPLRQGRNTVLLKINNGDGDHGFYLSIASEQVLRLAAPK